MPIPAALLHLCNRFCPRAAATIFSLPSSSSSSLSFRIFVSIFTLYCGDVGRDKNQGLQWAKSMSALYSMYDKYICAKNSWEKNAAFFGMIYLARWQEGDSSNLGSEKASAWADLIKVSTKKDTDLLININWIEIIPLKLIIKDDNQIAFWDIFALFDVFWFWFQ